MAEQFEDYWTGEEFAARISLDPALLARAKADWDAETQTTQLKPLSADDAREMVRGLINDQFAGMNVDSVQVKELARLIVEALPDEAMNGSVVAALDVRPYIQLVASEPDRFMGKDFVKKPRNNTNYPRTFAPLAENWQQLQEEDYRTQGTAYRQDNKAGVSPVITAAEQTTQMAGGLEQYPGMQGSTVDLSDMAYLLRTGQVDLTNPDLLASLMDVGNIPGVFTNAPSGQPRVTQRELPSGKVIGRTTVGGALDWVYGLNEQEVSTLQALVASAGYMTDMHYDPQTDQTILQDYSYEDGYANDAVFQQAWRTAVMEAKANQVPLGQWLTRKTVEFKQREDSFRKRLTEERIGTFNSALTDVRTAADRLAMDTVGRRLKPEEFVQVRQYLRSLQQERIDDPYTNTPDDWMKSDPQRGFTQDELTGQVSSVLEPEMMRSRQVEADRQLRSWLGMD